MEISLTVPRDDFDADTFDRCIAAFGEIVERSDEVRFTITTDLVAAVREKVSDPEYADAYEQQREFASAIAKTIRQDDGTFDLIVDAGLLSYQTEPGGSERSFQHEAYHIAVGQRGESLNDLRLRKGLDLSSARGVYLGMAGVASEEFRVENVLWSDGDDQRHSLLKGFTELVLRLDECIGDASCQYQNDLDVSAVSRTVGESFHAVATWTAYLAAKGDTDPPLDLPQDLDDRVLGKPWRAVVAELARLPGADVPTERADLDAHAERVAQRLADWLKHIGFEWEDTDEGLYFHVLKPEQWVA